MNALPPPALDERARGLRRSVHPRGFIVIDVPATAFICLGSSSIDAALIHFASNHSVIIQYCIDQCSQHCLSVRPSVHSLTDRAPTCRTTASSALLAGSDLTPPLWPVSLPRLAICHTPPTPDPCTNSPSTSRCRIEVPNSCFESPWFAFGARHWDQPWYLSVWSWWCVPAREARASEATAKGI